MGLRITIFVQEVSDMRLIDADIARKRIWKDIKTGYETCSMSWFASWLDVQETIDAVPVVRCGDCKWYDSAFYACSKCGVCVNRDFYCADGERSK